MAREVEVTGMDGLLAFSKGLKAAGEGGLRRELNKRIRTAAKPLIAETKAAAARELPKRGGLAKQVASTPQRIAVQTGNRPGIRIVVSKRAGVRATNRGTVRHPVFADKSKPREQWTWVTQPVAAGWFDKTLNTHVIVIRKAINDTVKGLFDEIAKEAGRG